MGIALAGAGPQPSIRTEPDRRPDVAVDAEALRRARLMEDLMAGRPGIGGPFTLTDTSGTRRSLDEYRGKLVLLYFGYTFCPDVCPTDLQQMSLTLAQLGNDSERVQAIFVTVDPERDTPSHLARYLAHFDPRLIGLSGSVAEIKSVAERYRAYFAKVALKNSRHYLVDHSANIYVVGPDGRYLASFPPGTPAARLLDFLREHLSRQRVR